MDGSTVVAMGTVTVSLLTTMGAGVAWVARHMANTEKKFEARLLRVEKRYSRLHFAFQMVAGELSRIDPGNRSLLRAHEVLAAEYGDPLMSDDIDGASAGDLLNKV